jgi:hypothetical protein
LKKTVLETKQATYKHFLENLNYKQAGLKAYTFLATLNNEVIHDKNKPILLRRKEITNNKGFS